MVTTTVGPTMPDMSDAPTMNGHLSPLAASVPAVALTQVPVAAPPLGGGVPRSSAQPAPSARVKRKGNWDRGLETFLTVLAAAIAQVTSAQAMWRFTEDQLHLASFGARASTFAIFEVAMLACAWRARRTRITYGTSSLAEKAVWAIALTIGVLLASDEASIPAMLARFAAPLLAAFLFEQLILDHAKAAEEAKTGVRKPKGTWRISPTRILVKIGLRDPVARDVADVDLTRAMSRLATLRYEADLVAIQSPKRRAAALRRYQRSVAKANEEYNLATHPTAMDKFMASLALLHGAVESSTAEAVASASPWVRASNRAEKDLNGTTSRARASQPARTTQAPRVTENVREPRPHNPGHDRVREVAPTTRTRRSADETYALYLQLVASHPDWTQPQYAAALGISETRLRQVRSLYAKTD